MKNFLLLSNIVLAIAIAILFYLHFSTCKKCSVPAASASARKQGGNFKIAYFDLDSVETSFEYYKQLSKNFGSLEQQKRNELATKKETYIAKVKEYQAKGQAMSQAELAAAQQDISQREKDYSQDEQEKSQELQEENFKMLQDVKKKIEDYLMEYNKDKTYSFIISNSADIVYYKDSAYDITKDLVKGLNELYKAKK